MVADLVGCKVDALHTKASETRFQTLYQHSGFALQVCQQLHAKVWQKARWLIHAGRHAPSGLLLQWLLDHTCETQVPLLMHALPST